MIQLINLFSQTDGNEEVRPYAGGIRKFINDCGCDGIETIYDGTEVGFSLQKDIVIGYHLIFYADWLDFWRGDVDALNHKFGLPEMWEDFYLGGERESLLGQLRADLLRAEDLGVKYVVFHVSDVSIEEGYTYRWKHTDEEVIDAAAEVINLLLDGQNYSFEFLMENLHWPGLTFTRPEMTERLLAKVHYHKKGIMLDTGHLMCTNLDIKNQVEGCRYINRMLDEHGDLCRYIRGVHLHQSVTGDYVKWAIKNQPELKGNYYEQFAEAYSHILKIDKHQPFNISNVHTLIKRISPEYLVHEISANTLQQKQDLTKIQQAAIMGNK